MSNLTEQIKTMIAARKEEIATREAEIASLEKKLASLSSDEKGYAHSVTDEPRSVFYLVGGQYHRTDGPAIEYANGDKEWWLNGKLHRTDGPAIEYAYGTVEFWLDGERLTEVEFKTAVKRGKKLSKR